MSIELRDLKWAIAISQHRSIRRAAEALNVRQSTLSRRLRNVEGLLGVQLFERTNGGTITTVIGREFLASARHILGEADLALQNVRKRSRGETGRLAIGVYASLSTGNLFTTLMDYHRSHPEVEVYTVDGGHDELKSGLAIGTVDVAIMTNGWLQWDDCELSLWSERVIVALPTRHALAEREAIGWSDLAEQPMLTQRNGPGPELERILNAKVGTGVGQRILYQECGFDRLLSLVAAEYGLTLMLEGASGARYSGVTYREIREGSRPIRLDFSAYWRKSNDNPTLGPFLALLRQRYPDLALASEQE